MWRKGIDVAAIRSGMKPVLLLLSDSYREDQALATRAFSEAAPDRRLIFVQSIDDLHAYLRHSGSFSGPSTSPRPGIIVLDVSLSEPEGQQALSAIKSNPEFRRLPVLVLSNALKDEEVFGTYDAGVNAFINRPGSYDEWFRLARGIDGFWFKIARLPD